MPKKSLRRGLFRRLLTLAAGAAGAQAVTIAVSGLLGRLYDAPSFSVYGLYFSALTIVQQAVCLKLETALLTAPDADADGLFWLGLALCGLTPLPLLALLPFGGQISGWFSAESSAWLWYLPLSAALDGASILLVQRNLRMGRQRDILLATVVKALATAAVQVALGWAAVPGGLMIGQLAGFLAGNLRLIRNLRGIARPHPRGFWALLRRYRRFPFFTLPGNLLYTLAMNVPSFLVGALLGGAWLGPWAMLGRAVSAPLGLVGNAVGQGFLERFSAEKGAPEVFRGTLWFLLAPAAVLAAALWFGAEGVAGLLGGARTQLVFLIRVLSPMFLLRFVATPLSNVAIATGRQRQLMFWQAGLLGLTLLPAALCRGFGWAAEGFFTALGVGCGAGYLGLLLYCLYISNREGKKNHAGITTGGRGASAP